MSNPRLIPSIVSIAPLPIPLATKWLPTSPQAGFLTHSQSLWTLWAMLPPA